MATSGSDDFNLTADSIVTEICDRLQLIPTGGTVPGEVYDSIVRTLNLMLKTWQTDGVYLNLTKELYLFTTAEQQSYQMGNSSAEKIVSSYLDTTISADELSGQTTISVTSSSGMAASDVIGIELDDNTMHWTTISSVPGATSVIINAALPSDAASGNMVYTYDPADAVTNKPFEISSVRVRPEGSLDNEIKVYPKSRRVYFNIPNKAATGTPIQYYVDKQNSYIKLYIYPTVAYTKSVMALTCQLRIQDIDASTNDMDLPQEWLDTIILCGCVAVAPKFGKVQAISELVAGTTSIANQAMLNYKKLKNTMQEYTSIKIRPWIRR